MSILSKSPFSWVCPECHGPLEQLSSGGLRCRTERIDFEFRDGVVGFLTEDRYARYRQFLHEYQTVRTDEGRSLADPETYRALPFVDLTGRHRAEWRIRGASYRSLLRHVVEPLATATGPLAVAVVAG